MTKKEQTLSGKLSARSFAVNILKLLGIYDTSREFYESSHFGTKDTKRLFTRIFRENTWGGKESVSGTGSSLDQTRKIIEVLPALLTEFEISTMLDLPCGDFFWMQKVDLCRVRYTGGDLVDELVKRNQQQYGAANIRFRQFNLLVDRLPSVDLIFCRDCLVHLSLEQADRALRNICQSNSKYLLTTTFPMHPVNRDILTGGWRTLNLQSPPFSLPSPLKLINEECREGEDVFDKSLGLWKIAEIKKILSPTLGRKKL